MNTEVYVQNTNEQDFLPKRNVFFRLILEFCASFSLVFFVTGLSIFSKDTGLGFIFYINELIILRVLYTIVVFRIIFIIFRLTIKDVDITFFSSIKSYGEKKYNGFIFTAVFLTQIAGALTASFCLYLCSDFLLNTWVVADAENYGSTLGAQITAIEGPILSTQNRITEFKSPWLLVCIQVTLNVFLILVFIKMINLLTINYNYIYYSKKEREGVRFSIVLWFFIILLIATKFNANGFSFARVLAPTVIAFIFGGANGFVTTTAILIEQMILGIFLFVKIREETIQKEKKSKLVQNINIRY